MSMSKPRSRNRTAIVLSFALTAMVAFGVAGSANSLMLAIFGSAAITTGIIHHLFPASTHFNLSLANLISVYASIFAVFAEEAFGRIGPEVLGFGFSVPLMFFVLGCWLRRADLQNLVEKTDVRSRHDPLGALRWLLPVLAIGAVVLGLAGVAEAVINNNTAFIAAMFLLGLIVLSVSRDVAMFLVEAGFLFDEFFTRISRLVMPAFAFLTFYSLLVVAFATFYSIMSQHSSVFHFRVGGTGRIIGFPEAIHFSITTLSTVGYGDIVPASNLARIVASLEVVCGVLLLLFGVSELLEYSREHRIAGSRRDGDRQST